MNGKLQIKIILIAIAIFMMLRTAYIYSNNKKIINNEIISTFNIRDKV